MDDKTEINEINNESSDNCNFKLEDVSSDGSCFFRCVARQLFYHLKEDDINKLFSKNYSENYNNIFGSPNYSKNMDKDEEENLARELQEIAKNWLIDHKYDKVDITQESVEDLVLSTHEVKSMDEYDRLYSIFSGDEDYLIVPMEITNNKGKKSIKKYKLHIDGRWGGFPEQYALSKYFNIDLDIYSLFKYNKNNEIIEGNIFKRKDKIDICKGVFFKKQHSIFSPSELNIENKIKLNILWLRKKNGLGHYMILK